MKKEYTKAYFTHILLSRLETHDRKDEDLKFFRPSLFKKLYQNKDRDFVNDILIKHIDNMKVYYRNNANEVDFTYYIDKNKDIDKYIDGLIVEDNILKIKINKQEYTVLTPINQDREGLNPENFEPLELNDKVFASATIDHSPSLIKQKRDSVNGKFDLLFRYFDLKDNSGKKVRKNATGINDELIKVIKANKKEDELWDELVSFYKESKIEIVHSKYNKRVGRREK